MKHMCYSEKLESLEPLTNEVSSAYIKCFNEGSVALTGLFETGLILP